MKYPECETCENFDEHPFIREGDWTDYCDIYNVSIDKVHDIIISPCLCEHYKEKEY